MNPFIKRIAPAFILLFICMSPVVATDIAGNWSMGGPYNVGMSCQIIQQGSDLTFINENGDQSSGKFIVDAAVIATDWEGGLEGTLSADGNRIDWANGTWWVRSPTPDSNGEVAPVSGEGPSQPCSRLILDLFEGPNAVVIAKVVDACENNPLQGVRLGVRVFHTYDNQLKKAINGEYVDREPMQTDENGEAQIYVLGNPGDIYRVDVYASNGEKWDTSDRSIHVTIGDSAI